MDLGPSYIRWRSQAGYRGPSKVKRAMMRKIVYEVEPVLPNGDRYCVMAYDLDDSSYAERVFESPNELACLDEMRRLESSSSTP